ncbi:MAG: glycosyltransferase [Prevotellaceae bacterium]|nr:glycosyltransferase [Prevotellaceae bacterium]
MKNILILCDALPPSFAPRMGYLCKYLPSLGWKPIVITEYNSQKYYKNITENENVTCINFFHNKKNNVSKLKYLFVFIADYLFDYKEVIIKNRAKKLLKNNNISIILSSNSFRTCFAKAAMELAVKHQIPFVLDIRDIFEQFPNDEYASRLLIKSNAINDFVTKHIKKHFLKQRNSILPKANTITTVSEWHRDFLKKFNPNVQLIYNGFDPDLFNYQKVNAEKFKITYVGRIESLDIKNPTLLFEAVKILADKKLIEKDKFRLEFYLINETSKEIIKTLSQKFDVEEFITIFGTVQNIQVPEILNNSSILLLLANKATENKSPKGILGTKLFEYMAVEKPILCVRNDESFIEEIINKSNSGVAASNVEQSAEFILSKLNEWQTQGFTHQTINKDFIRQFSRKTQAEQFAKILSEM